MQIRLARMLATKNIETSSRWIIVILVRESATRKIKALHWGPRVKMKILFFFPNGNFSSLSTSQSAIHSKNFFK